MRGTDNPIARPDMDTSPTPPVRVVPLAERPDLVLRGQQLPEGEGADGLRPPDLELRLHPHAGRQPRLLPAQLLLWLSN